MTFISDTGVGSQNPVFDYSSRDYNSVLNDLIARIPVYLPEWTSQSTNDFGIVLLSMYAYVVDNLGYYLDRLAGEAFIQTATQPTSVYNIAAMLDYTPTLSVGATTELQITLSPTYPIAVTIPEGTVFQTVPSQGQAGIPFVTTSALTIPPVNQATPGSGIGSVVAVQGVQITSEAVATSNGFVNQAYPLLNSPVTANSLTLDVDLGQGPQAWTYVQTLLNSGPSDQVYTNFVDPNGIFYVVFGDGVNGLVPPLGSPITATYQINVGALGNVGAGTITQIVSALVGVASVTNTAGAAGGTYAESISSIQQKAPASLRTLNRAVTTEDFAVLAQQVSGVEWASAAQSTYQLVNLYIAPFGGGAPTSILLNAVDAFVDPLAMANTTVSIFGPTYVPINITVNVVAFANFANSVVQQNVITALTNLLQQVNTGFGFLVHLGLVYEAILAVQGVNYCDVTGLQRQMLTSLTTPLFSSSVYSTLSVSELPSTVNIGDQLVISNPTQLILSQTLTQGNSYSALSFQGTSFTITNGDVLVIGFNTPTPQTVTATETVSPGATSITVSTFVPATTYDEGTLVDDTTAVGASQVVTATAQSGPGAEVITVGSFTANANYPATLSVIQDITQFGDCPTLANEIPSVGTITVNVTGGFET